MAIDGRAFVGAHRLHLFAVKGADLGCLAAMFGLLVDFLLLLASAHELLGPLASLVGLLLLTALHGFARLAAPRSATRLNSLRAASF